MTKHTQHNIDGSLETSTASVRLRWHRRVGITGVIWAAAMNIAWLLVSIVFLGQITGWLSPQRADYPEVFGYGIPLLQFLLLAYLLDQIFRFFLRRWTETQALGRPPPRLGLQLGRMVIYFAFVAMAISLVFQKSIAGILAASGVIGLVMGFALRGLVSDLFFGIALHIDRNLSIGDWVDVAYRGRDISGQIRDIHWRSVVLHDMADNIVLVPNSEFASAVVVNRSKPLPVTEYSTYISVGNEYESGRILAALEMVLFTLRDEEKILGDPAPRAQIAQIDNGLVRYRMTCAVPTRRGEQWEIQSLILRHAIQYLRAAGCVLYPQLPNYVNPDKPVADRPQDSGVRQRVVGSIPLFRILAPDAIAAIVENLKVEMYPAGHVLIEAGAPGDTMWIIGEGALDVMADINGKSTHVATLWPGDWVGEMSVLTGEPRNAKVQVQKPSLIYAVDKPTMEKVFESDAHALVALAQIAGRRRKVREGAFPALTHSQDFAKTKSTSARIRAFFGMPESV